MNKYLAAVLDAIEAHEQREAKIREAADIVAEASERGEGVLLRVDALAPGGFTITASPLVPRGTAYVVDMNKVSEVLRDGCR